MSTYNYYVINCNRLEKRLQEQNEFNTRLELELKATKTQFEDAFDYFKKESCKIKQLKTIIDQLIVSKIKTNIVLLLVKILIDMSQHFIYTLFSLTIKSQSVSSI